MDLTLSYRALASGQVDLIAGDATAGLIKGSISCSSRTTRHYFPAVRCGRGRAGRDAAAVSARCAIALERLSGRVSAADMRAMNYAADVEHRDIAADRARVSGQIAANQRCRPAV